MGQIIFSKASEIRDALGLACLDRELLILAAPEACYESCFLQFEPEALHVQMTMSLDQAASTLRVPGLRIRFPHGSRFLEGPSRLLGFGMLNGQKTLRLALPNLLQDNELRRAYRVDRVGTVAVSFSTARFELKRGLLVNISTTGARIACPALAQDEVKNGDTLAVTIPLTVDIHINTKATARWTDGRHIGLQFTDSPESRTLHALSRWVFAKREEAQNQPDPGLNTSLEVSAPLGARKIALLSSSQELEGILQEALTDLPPLVRTDPTIQGIKEALAGDPLLLIVHVRNTGLDERKRLRMLLEPLNSKRPFILLAMDLEAAALFELGSELKALGAHVFKPGAGPFFRKILQGILQRCQTEQSRDIAQGVL